MQRPAFVIAITAGVLATGLAFFSSAGAEDRRFDDPPARVATAVFAGGCFWCVEADFDKVDGVIETISGYTGGHVDNPTYKQVTRGDTGHYEAVKVTYDPAKVSYDELAQYFVRHIDPTDAKGQFCDKGTSYRSAIFVSGQGERDSAETVLDDAGKVLKRDVVTEVLPAGAFWPAEDYHQDYHIRSAVKYDFYRSACGRDARVEQLWGKAPKGS
ncbi:MAG: peptide-methionine (S)-S-oxide reductase MsrA [Acidobacteria bacterium]|jgi:peptide-methionine (S)-S-oxide reductase|nr:peptide-methionine (S)-S-oxide reductase MsrA [Acidobacteriota bacterium]